MSGWLVARMWQGRDRSGWRNFAIAMATLAAALVLSLYSAAVAEQGRVWTASVAAVMALALAGWVAIAIVPRLARRTSLHWLIYQIDYRLTREGVVYLGSVFLVVLAAVNTGNNLLFMLLSCLLAGILVSGVLSRTVLAGIELKLELPEHIFAEQPVLATVEVRNEKEKMPSFSLRVIGGTGKGPAQILAKPVFFPYIPRQTAARQKVELAFARRGVYRQDAFGVRTKFPFGLFEKTRRIDSPMEIVVYPHVEPAEQFYEILPLLSGEMESYFRGRGHDLYALRDYQATDSARFVDWKSSAKTGSLKVREFTREDERRLILVLDPLVGPPRASPGEFGSTERDEQFERAIALAASIAWHFHEINAVMQFRTDRNTTPMASAPEIIYDVLRELAFLQPDESAVGGAFLDDLVSEADVFKIILTSRSQGSIPSALWSSSYFIFMDSL
jgi:uncharacterized protein (DUF58 family)